MNKFFNLSINKSKVGVSIVDTNLLIISNGTNCAHSFDHHYSVVNLSYAMRKHFYGEIIVHMYTVHK